MPSPRTPAARRSLPILITPQRPFDRIHVEGVRIARGGVLLLAEGLDQFGGRALRQSFLQGELLDLCRCDRCLTESEFVLQPEPELLEAVTVRFLSAEGRDQSLEAGCPELLDLVLGGDEPFPDALYQSLDCLDRAVRELLSD